MSQGSGDGVPAYSGEPENWAGAGLERREQKEKYPALPSRAPQTGQGLLGPWLPCAQHYGIVHLQRPGLRCDHSPGHR